MSTLKLIDIGSYLTDNYFNFFRFYLSDFVFKIVKNAQTRQPIRGAGA